MKVTVYIREDNDEDCRRYTYSVRLPDGTVKDIVWCGLGNAGTEREVRTAVYKLFGWEAQIEWPEEQP